MIGTHKKFSQSLFNRNDPKSRTVVKEYFNKQGIPLNDNDNKYGVDLISEDGTLHIEIEHRLVWTNDEFPYKEVNVPERKAKFFVENHIGYVILSADYSHMGVIDGKTLRLYMVAENLKESPNRFVKENEFFYKVPVDAFKWTKI